MRFAKPKNGIHLKQGLLVAIATIGLGLALAGLNAMNSVKPAISTQTQSKLEQRRISLLEKALTAQTAEEAAQLWAKGVQTRNGALQYAVLSPELRLNMKANYADKGWITGVSSPWVENYKIINQIPQDDGWEFEIEYQLMTSTGRAGTEKDRIQVHHFKGDRNHLEGWYITELKSAAKAIRFI